MKKTVRCDLHIHSQYSDGRMSIRDIVDFHGRKGFGAIAITDHLCEKNNIIGRFSHGLNYSLSEQVFQKYMQELKEEGQRSLEVYGMHLIPGFEITKNSFANHRSAHILILGVDQFINPELSVDEILVSAKEQNGFTVAAHPFHTGELEFQTFHLWSRRQELAHLIDAWEVNSRKTISSDVLNSGLPLIANSDFHRLPHYNSWKTKVYSENTPEALFAAIKKQQIDFFMDSLESPLMSSSGLQVLDRKFAPRLRGGDGNREGAIDFRDGAGPVCAPPDVER